MRKALGLCAFVLLSALVAHSQTSNSIYTDNVGSARYSNIDGSPYLYKEWLEAEVIASSGKVYNEAKANFNGYTQQIEYYEGEEIKEMMQGSYLKVSFLTNDGKQAFVRGLHADFGMDLACLLYDGQGIDFVKKMTISVQEYNTPNATISKFIPSVDYFFIKKGRLTKIPLKEKKILAFLKEDAQALEKYTEDQNLNLRKEIDVIRLLEFYESRNN